jgi:cytoskeletal protein CcmA (bactofilin family)
MGTSTSATWLLSGTSNGVFRAGIQALDTPSPGELRIYESANVIRFSANQLIAPALSVTGNIVGTGILTITGTATIDGNLRGGNLLTSGNANVGNLGLSGLLTSTGTVTIDGNVRGGNLLTSGNANVGNLGTAGLITATGNIQGGNLITSGNLLVGITTPLTVTTVSPRAQIKGTDANTSALLLNRNSADANPPAIWLAKDRAGGAVVSGDELGVIRFLGDDGTDYINAARIKADVDGTVSANNVPGRLIFETSTANSITPTERMRINSTGNISIGNTGVASYSTVNILRTNSYNTDPDQGLAYGTITANAVDSGRSYAWRTRATGNASAGISSVTESITRDGTWTERTRITSDGTLSVTGNVTANYLFGNGSQLTGVGVSGFTSNVGNASANSFTITHNLNKEDIFVTVREYSSGYLVYPDIKYANANAIILDFVSAPTANQYRVSVFGF